MIKKQNHPEHDFDNIKGNFRLMIFDLTTGGHHEEYILHLVNYWCSRQIPGQLFSVVSPKFMENNLQEVRRFEKYSADKLLWLPVETAELQLVKKKPSKIRRSMVEWCIFSYYAKKFAVGHTLFMYLDSLQIPLILGLPAPCKLSGIYFRPTLHYGEFSWYKPTFIGRLRDLRKKLLLFRWLRHPSLENVFCLDPFAVKSLRRLAIHTRIFPLPDPVEFTGLESGMDASLRESLKIEPHRKVFLLFGNITRVKGVFQLLDSLRLLSLEDASRIAVLLIGKAKNDLEDQLQEQIKKTLELKPVQIKRINEFIPQNQIMPYFAIADLVLIPYQRHVGSSGILMRSAVLEKPVLASDYGLVGEQVRKFGLGLTIDATKPTAIAGGIATFLHQDLSALLNKSSVCNFVHDNTPENFANVIFNHLL